MKISTPSVRPSRRRLAPTGALLAAVALSVGVSGPAAAEAEGPELVVNGNFASPPVPAGATFVTSVPGWTLIDDRLDVSSDYTVPAGSPSGTQAADLGVNIGPVAIEQDVSTVDGEPYTLTYQLAGNPACPEGIRTGTVSLDGTQVGSLDFDTTGHSAAAMGWRSESHTFTATGSATSVNFTGTNPGGCGPVVTNVSVKHTPVVDVAMVNGSVATVVIGLLVVAGGVAGVAFVVHRRRFATG